MTEAYYIKFVHLTYFSETMIAIYTVDAFTRELFKGNPAGVCTSFRNVSTSTKFDQFFQQIATEMNISETAFITKANDSPSDSRYFLQWFTPTSEVNLCGHATLATAHILFEQFLQNSPIDELVFETKNVGELKVKKCDNQGRLQLDFPMGDPQPIEFDHQILNEIKSKLNITQDILNIQLCKRTKKLLLELSTIDDTIKPQQTLVEINFDPSIHPFIRGIILTTKSTSTIDFISRYFAPWVGILEDPVTGSAHTVLAVYWSRILKKSILHGYQKSARGGDVECEIDNKNQRVLLRGYAITVMQGQFQIQQENLLKKD
jgi:PhzF family phenazine biosynthesis protein